MGAYRKKTSVTAQRPETTGKCRRSTTKNKGAEAVALERQPFTLTREDGPGRQASNSRSFSMIFLSFVRGTAPELGVRSDDRPPQTLRAFGAVALSERIFAIF